MRMLDLLLKKRSGLELAGPELEFIASGAASGDIPDYQLSAWLMAVFFKGLTKKETAAFTKAMALSGARLNLKSVKGAKVDKHSTGGVGDGVSLALAPVVAACGVVVPMMSGRGLGHTGGTLDKLESVKGFKVRLSPASVLSQLKATGLSMFGQTAELAPSDKKLYALRDASCTVESLPLIVASILSKKYAEDITGLVMDVKYGSGAFLKDFKKSRELAVALMETAKLLGIRCVALLTAMEEPLGLAVGNAVEIEQSVRILQGEKGPADFTRVLEALSGWMIYLGAKARTPEEGEEKARRAIVSGAALEKLRLLFKWQGGDARVADNPGRFLPKAKLSREIKAGISGYLTRLDSRTIGHASVMLGAGRERAEDTVDFGAGILLSKKLGDKVKPGEVMARLYASDSKKLSEGARRFESALGYGARPPKKEPLIREIIQ
ncbi:MAG TPA: thymidine phosphorylase [Elusimicrobia bacterium]|nr:thymidine phosphorylase [Elusimicrobiota bacterium]